MNMQSATLLPIIRENKQGSIIYMNFYRGYDILKLYLKEYEWRFNHSDLKKLKFLFQNN
ncbi:IS1016 transposase [Haemophilus aegyptius]|nr:IS1016 transposase [Haemophilus aegyptius]